MIKLGAILTIVALGFATAQTQQSSPKCGACLASSDALCKTENTYIFCFNGVQVGNVMECSEGTVCSNSASICVPETDLNADVVNVCGGATGSGCQACATGDMYTCVSRNQAGRCINGVIAAVIDCPEDEICVTEGQKLGTSVCMPQVVANYMKANATCTENDDYTTTTPAPAPTPSPGDRVNACTQASADKVTLFFYTNYDSTCKTAVYCQRSSLTSSDWVTFFKTCPSATPYFDTITRNCVSTKPASCKVVSTTTTAPPSTTTTPISTQSSPSTTEVTAPPSTTTTPISTESSPSTPEVTAPPDTTTTLISTE